MTRRELMKAVLALPLLRLLPGGGEGLTRSCFLKEPGGEWARVIERCLPVGRHIEYLVYDDVETEVDPGDEYMVWPARILEGER